MPTTIATEIRTQLGHRALVMLGAKNLVDTGRGLTFKIGRNGRGVTHLDIALDPDDTYRVRFLRVRGHVVTETAVRESAVRRPPARHD